MDGRGQAFGNGAITLESSHRRPLSLQRAEWPTPTHCITRGDEEEEEEEAPVSCCVVRGIQPTIEFEEIM